MIDPKQSCPKCGCEIGKILYCTPLNSDKYYCPDCKIKIQEKCSKCGTWLTVLERYCQKCGLKNIFFHHLTKEKRNKTMNMNQQVNFSQVFLNNQ